MGLIVERRDALALAGGADYYLPALNAGEVEGVHRLTVLEHNVICYVNYIRYRPYAACAEAAAHPAGAGADLYVFDHSCGVPRAELGVFYRNADEVGGVSAGALDDGGVELQLRAEGGGCLAGKADNGEAVGPVGRYLKFDLGIKGADELADIHSDLRVLLGDYPDPVLYSVGEIVGIKSELAEGAEHTEAFDPAQLALLDLLAAGQKALVLGDGNEVARMHVLRAGHDLNGLVADVHLADPEVIRVGVALDGLDSADDHVFDLVAHRGEGLHLGAGEGHSLRKFLIGNMSDVGELTEPFS